MTANARHGLSPPSSIGYLRNIERLPEAVLNTNFMQKDLNNQIASLKKISDLWSETKKAAAEATAR